MRVRVLFSLCACVYSLFSLSGFALGRSFSDSVSRTVTPFLTSPSLSRSLPPSYPRSALSLQQRSKNLLVFLDERTKTRVKVHAL